MNIDINYTYDNVNNRLSRTDTTTSGSDPAGTETMSYDNANELLNLNSITYTYDYNGNRTQKVDGNTTTAYTYDNENRLVGVQVAVSGTTTQTITYTYDPFGRRIQKNVNGTITNYVYDKDAIILAYNQAGNVTARYTHGLRIDEPLAMDNTSQVYYYHADALGSIAALTSSSGTVSQTYVYDSFGNITGTPTITQPYTYTAREYDPGTGLYFYRARYYDPIAGRFLTRDPIGFRGGVNLYTYVKNNAVNRKDPFGLQDFDTDIGANTYSNEASWNMFNAPINPGIDLGQTATGLFTMGSGFLTMGIGLAEVGVGVLELSVPGPWSLLGIVEIGQGGMIIGAGGALVNIGAGITSRGWRGRNCPYK